MTNTTKLLWYGKGPRAGWRLYRSLDGTSTFTMFCGGRGATAKHFGTFRKVPHDQLPQHVREAVDKALAKEIQS